MATLSQTKICLFWYLASQGISQPSIAWNNDPHASPDDLTGGIPFNTGHCLDEPMFLSACGTGDAGVEMAFALNQFFIGGLVPSTYIPGWPNALGGIDAWDPATLLGGAGISGNTLTNGGGPGSVQSKTGWTRGRFCVQYKVHYDIFSQSAGAGIMRAGSDLSGIFSGEKSAADHIGGVMTQGGNGATVPPYQTVANAFGVANAPSPFLGFPDGSIVTLAIAIIPQFNYVPSPFSAVKLPDLICCPVTRHRAHQIATSGLHVKTPAIRYTR